MVLEGALAEVSEVALAAEVVLVVAAVLGVVLAVAEAADAAVDVADLIFIEKSLHELLQGLFFCKKT